MLHLPAPRFRGLADALQQHLTRVLGLKDALRGWRKRLKITGDSYGTPGMITDRQNAGLIRYLSKSIDPSERVGQVPLADILGIEPKPHAPVVCKRVGTSENIGPKARLSSGWTDISDLQALRAYLNPPSRPQTRAAQSGKTLGRQLHSAVRSCGTNNYVKTITYPINCHFGLHPRTNARQAILKITTEARAAFASVFPRRNHRYLAGCADASDAVRQNAARASAMRSSWRSR
jgi:hypothetical protein